MKEEKKSSGEGASYGCVGEMNLRVYKCDPQ